MQKYGLPYVGSKQRYAERILNLLPEADTLVDIFGGGAAITDCARASGKFRHVVYNEKNALMCQAVDMAVNGKFPDKPRWVSREEFHATKTTDPYAALCYSFSSNMVNYIYGADKEEGKRAVFRLIYDFDDTGFKRLYPQYDITPLDNITDFEQRRQFTQRLCRNAFELRCIPRHNSLRFTPPKCAHTELTILNLDYREVDVPRGAVIYADPPYRGAAKYRGETFCHETFYDWCCCQKAPLFISERYMPEDRFVCIDRFEHKGVLANNNTKKQQDECIFRPRHQVE